MQTKNLAKKDLSDRLQLQTHTKTVRMLLSEHDPWTCLAQCFCLSSITMLLLVLISYCSYVQRWNVYYEGEEGREADCHLLQIMRDHHLQLKYSAAEEKCDLEPSHDHSFVVFVPTFVLTLFDHPGIIRGPSGDVFPTFVLDFLLTIQGVQLGFTQLFKKIYPRARFELPSRRHCSEKLGAVSLLYLMKKMLWRKWSVVSIQQVTFFDQLFFLPKSLFVLYSFACWFGEK